MWFVNVYQISVMRINNFFIMKQCQNYFVSGVNYKMEGGGQVHLFKVSEIALRFVLFLF